MPWDLVVSLLIKFGPSGFALAQELIKKWTSGKPATVEDIAELQALASKNSRSQMEEALNRAGIKLDSPEGQRLLALV